MSKLREFSRDVAGSMIEKVALFSAIVAMTSVFGANLLSKMLQKGELPTIALVLPDGHLKRIATSAPTPATGRGAVRLEGAGVDMSATASIPGGGRAASPLFPCEKERK